MKIFTTIGLIFVALHVMSQSVMISEVVSKNISGLKDFEGDTPDWIELQNTSELEIQLNEFYLTDDKDNLKKWPCPSLVLAPNAYVYFYASGKDTLAEKYHTNFKIKQSGENIYISKLENGNITVVDKLSGLCIPSDHSAGRTTIGGEFLIFSAPSAGSTNSSNDLYLQASDSVVWDLDAGFYTTDQKLNLETSLASEIRYTLNGETPKDDDHIYKFPLSISLDSIPELTLALSPSSIKWISPILPLDRALVVSAKPFHLGCPIGPIEKRSYFIDQKVEINQLAHVSLSMDTEAFIGDEGIYVPGSSGENYLKRGKAWEKEAFMEYFDESGFQLVSTSVGLRIHGSGSRNDPHKSLRVYIRPEDGKESIKNIFWPGRAANMDVYSLVLNSGQSDFTRSLLKDHLAANVLEGMYLDDQKSKLVEVFINGEYWGLQFLQEHISSNHLAELSGVDSENINIIEDEGNISEGNGDSYESLFSFIRTNDLSSVEKYQTVESMIDIENFIDYNLVNLYFSNWDWPKNNVKLWSADQSDFERLRWVLTDCDACFYVSDFNSLKNFNVDEFNASDAEHQLLLSKLLSNQKFLQQFKIRAYELMELNFNPDFLLSKFDSIVQEIEPHLPEHMNRWHYPESMEAWNAQVKEMEYFIVNRHMDFFRNLETLYLIPFFAYPNPANTVIKLPEESAILDLKFRLYNVSGALLKKGTNQSSMQIDISNFESGVYILNFETSAGLSWNQRIIIVE